MLQVRNLPAGPVAVPRSGTLAGRSRFRMSRLLVVLGLVTMLLFPSSSSVAAVGRAARRPAQPPPEPSVPARASRGRARTGILHGRERALAQLGEGLRRRRRRTVAQARPTTARVMNDAFATAKANGANVVRWWVFEGDAWQIKRDGSGAPTGLVEDVFADFDAAAGAGRGARPVLRLRAVLGAVAPAGVVAERTPASASSWRTCPGAAVRPLRATTPA